MGKLKKKARFKTGVLKIGPILILIIVKCRNIYLILKKKIINERIFFNLILKRLLRVLSRSILIDIKKKKSYWYCGRDKYQTLNYFAIKAVNNKAFPPVLKKELTAAMGDKKTHKGIPYPVEPHKKKRKSDNSVFIRFLKILIIMNTSLLNRIMELNNFNNNLDYNVVVIYTWEELILRPTIAIMEPRSGNYSIIQMKLY